MHDSFSGLFFKKQKKQEKFIEKIKEREQITDNIELEVAEYLTHLSSTTSLSEDATRRVRSMHSMINDLERMGDIYYQMAKNFEDMKSLLLALQRQAVLVESKLLVHYLQYINSNDITLSYL